MVTNIIMESHCTVLNNKWWHHPSFTVRVTLKVFLVLVFKAVAVAVGDVERGRFSTEALAGAAATEEEGYSVRSCTACYNDRPVIWSAEYFSARLFIDRAK